MSTASNCIFCAIAAGKAPCHKIMESDNVLAFMDLFPANDGHALVIPKQHFETIYDANDAALAEVFAVARRLALALRAEFAPDGLTVSQANGEAAGQTVPHYHVHLIPRTAGAGRRGHGDRQADPDTLAAYAERLARAYAEVRA